MISPATIKRIREATDLQALAADYVAIKRSGPQYLCLCPLHSERNPSCRLWPDHYHCFTCGAHGSPIDWIMKLEGVGFAEALRILSLRTGVPLEAKPVTRRAMAYARQEAAMCRWWWARYRARLRAELDALMADESPLAEHMWRWLTWDPGPTGVFTFYREQVTAAERDEYRESIAWDKTIESAWMELASTPPSPAY